MASHEASSSARQVTDVLCVIVLTALLALAASAIDRVAAQAPATRQALADCATPGQSAQAAAATVGLPGGAALADCADGTKTPAAHVPGESTAPTSSEPTSSAPHAPEAPRPPAPPTPHE